MENNVELTPQVAIDTIRESCYQVGYPTNDAATERRKLINASCDYAIDCIKKVSKLEKLLENSDLYFIFDLRDEIKRIVND